MSEEKRSFGRVKGQTKAQSIIADPLLFPYEISVDEYSYVVTDSSKNGNNFCGSFTDLANAVNKIIQYQMASKRNTTTLSEYVDEFKSIKLKIKDLLEL